MRSVGVAALADGGALAHLGFASMTRIAPGPWLRSATAVLALTTAPLAQQGTLSFRGFASGARFASSRMASLVGNGSLRDDGFARHAMVLSWNSAALMFDGAFLARWLRSSTVALSNSTAALPLIGSLRVRGFAPRLRFSPASEASLSVPGSGHLVGLRSLRTVHVALYGFAPATWCALRPRLRS